MEDTEVQTRFQATDAPDDMILFQARMRLAGVRVRLPVNDPNFQLPELIPIAASNELPHETIVRLRGGSR